jgi:hypothetical protein
MERETAIRLLQALLNAGYGLQMPITNTQLQAIALKELRLEKGPLDHVLTFAGKHRWIDHAIAGHTIITKIGEAAAAQPASNNRAI